MDDIYRQQKYSEFATQLDQSRQTQSNLLIVTLPGFGVSALINAYLTRSPLEPEFYNILNLDFNRYPEALKTAQDRFAQAVPKQKFCLVVNKPALIESPEFKNSSLFTHFYSTYHLCPRSIEDCRQIVLSLSPKTKATQIKKIFDLSGGIVQLAKYLTVNQDKIENQDQLYSDPQLLSILKMISDGAANTSRLILQKLGAVNESGNWISQLMANWFVRHLSSTDFQIKANFDLSFEENGVKNPNQLTRTEKEIIDFILQHQNKISREEVSDLKWGQGKYDNFSDEAINVTMRRLNKKLRLYQVRTIPKVGYVLERRQRN